jgi:hypothetical protein
MNLPKQIPINGKSILATIALILIVSSIIFILVPKPTVTDVSGYEETIARANQIIERNKLTIDSLYKENESKLDSIEKLKSVMNSRDSIITDLKRKQKQKKDEITNYSSTDIIDYINSRYPK